MATLCKTYSTEGVARKAAQALRAAGVPGRDIRLLTGCRLRDVRAESVGTFAGTIGPGSAHIKAQNYLDLVLTARIGDHYNLRLGANNILDRIPPTLVTPAPFGNGNTYPQVYDSLGRYIFAGVTLDF